MKFLEVTMRNFRVYEKEQKVELDKQGLVAVQGVNKDSNGFRSNGAGKSSFLEAIIYCLYGKLSDGKTGDSVINNKVGNNMKVTFTFSIKDNVYRIERYRKDKDFKNKTLLFLNDKEITKSSVKLTNEAIEEITHLKLETLLNSIMFGLGNKVKFTEATDKDKKEILEGIANISIYKQAYDVAKEELDEVKEKINNLTNQSQVIQTRLDGYNSQKALYLSQKDQYDKYLSQLDNNVLTTKNDFEAFMSENSLHSIEELEDNYYSIEEDKKVIQAKLANMSNNSQAQQKYASIQQQVQYDEQQSSTLTSDIQDKKEKILKLYNSDNPVCEYCGSELDVEHKKKEIIRLGDIIKDDTSKLTTLTTSITASKKDMKELEPVILQEQKDKESYNQNLKLLNDYNTKQNALVSLSNTAKALKKDIESAKAEKANPQQFTLTSDKQLDTDIANAKNDLKNMQELLEKHKQEQKDLEDVEAVYSNKGVISHVLDLVMPYINEQANYYLSELTDNSIHIDIDTQSEAKNGNVSEKLNIKVDNLNGGNEYSLNSTGEKKRIDLAISLALQDYVMTNTSTKTNLIAYDEVFDGLDDIGIQRIMHLLKERIKDIPTVFVISHNDKLQELFESTLLVTKQEGLSTIEKE